MRSTFIKNNRRERRKTRVRTQAARDLGAPAPVRLALAQAHPGPGGRRPLGQDAGARQLHRQGTGGGPQGQEQVAARGRDRRPWCAKAAIAAGRHQGRASTAASRATTDASRRWPMPRARPASSSERQAPAATHTMKPRIRYPRWSRSRRPAGPRRDPDQGQPLGRRRQGRPALLLLRALRDAGTRTASSATASASRARSRARSTRPRATGAST